MDWELDFDLREQLINLVRDGYKQSEILQIVTTDFQQYDWSKRTLTRRLKHFEIKKHDPTVTVSEVLTCIRKELNGPGKLLGYRAMYKKLRRVYGLQIKQKQVYSAMRLLDPNGLKERKLVNKRKKFQRRVFTCKGPNWMWSIDGHDKLMGWHKCEYPLAIHGCVDTFSRKILWLKAWPSNSNPILPTVFYTETIRKHKVIPHFIRSDRGNENTTLFTLHNFLRGTNDGSSYLYGSSITNQVIERWWRDLRERNGNYFRSILENLTSTGLYNSGNETCRVILATLLIPLLQDELNVFKEGWNSHRIRKQNIRRPCGIPNFLYGYPETFGCEPAGHELDELRFSFVYQKLRLSEPIKYVQDEIHEQFKKILENASLAPVKFTNLIECYTLIYTGCKDRRISLQFVPIQ